LNQGFIGLGPKGARTKIGEGRGRPGLQYIRCSSTVAGVTKVGSFVEICFVRLSFREMCRRLATRG